MLALFLNLFQVFGDVCSVGGGVPVDCEVRVVFVKSQDAIRGQSLESAHRDRVCVRVFIGMSVRSCM